MIAFVIVAAALAFVVLNMGFATTQTAKTTIISGLQEASSSMQLAGKVIGSGDVNGGKLNATAFPIKIASGGNVVNLDEATTTIKYLSNSITYDNIYKGTLTSQEYTSLSSAATAATTASYISVNPYLNAGWPAATGAFIYWPQQRNTNEILDQGETAVIAIVYKDADRPVALDKIKAEIIVATGASLTVERQVPAITTSVVDLG
jgi:flagellin FlaB